jgi:hypothetical protein
MVPAPYLDDLIQWDYRCIFCIYMKLAVQNSVRSEVYAGFGPLFIDSSRRVIQNMRLPVFGGVPEWSKGADCKSAASASEVQILPPPPNL